MNRLVPALLAPAALVALTAAAPGAYPPGPNVALVNANCLGCHGPEMVAAAPRRNAAEWRATVDKMRKLYGAPVPERDAPAIVAYLTALSAGR